MQARRYARSAASACAVCYLVTTPFLPASARVVGFGLRYGYGYGSA